MTNPRRQYSPEYKQEAVGLVCQSDPAKKAFLGQGNPRDEGVARLKRESIEVKRERGFLPKGRHVRETAAYFAKQPK